MSADADAATAEPPGICPGGCGRRVQSGHPMDRLCWSKVPPHLQSAVYAAWRAYTRALALGADTATVDARWAAYEAARDTAVGSLT